MIDNENFSKLSDEEIDVLMKKLVEEIKKLEKDIIIKREYLNNLSLQINE